MNDILNWLLDFVASVDPVIRTLIAGVAIFLETSVFIGLIVPGDTVVIVASTGVASLPEYFWLAITVIVGTLGGQSVGFLLGRYFGPALRRSKLGQRIGEKVWQQAENFIDRRGGIAVFISRFLPVFHALTPVTVGMSNMAYRTFISWATPAAVLWGASYSAIGWVAKDAYESFADQLHYAGFIFVGIIVLFIVAAALVKNWLSKRTERDMTLPGDGDTTTRED